MERGGVESREESAAKQEEPEWRQEWGPQSSAGSRGHGYRTDRARLQGARVTLQSLWALGSVVVTPFSALCYILLYPDHNPTN